VINVALEALSGRGCELPAYSTLDRLAATLRTEVNGGFHRLVADYETHDGLGRYGFSIEFMPDRGWQVYIMLAPLYADHDDTLRLPYQSIDSCGRRYIDWPSKIDNLADARTISALWAELVQRYQRTHEQHALYVQLIERYQRSQEPRRASPATPASSPPPQLPPPPIPHPSSKASTSSRPVPPEATTSRKVERGRRP
jgi:hypothetical protein